MTEINKEVSVMCPYNGYYTFDYICIKRKWNLCFVVQNLQARLHKSECGKWKKETCPVHDIKTYSPSSNFRFWRTCHTHPMQIPSVVERADKDDLHVNILTF